MGGVLSGAASGAAYGSVAGPIGTVVGGAIGALKGAFGSGRDGGPDYAPQHGGFSGPGYGTPNTPGYDEYGFAIDPSQQGGGGSGVADDANNDFELGGKAGGAQDDVDRYRNLGANAYTQGAPNTDYTQANQARGSQSDALTMMQNAAQGNAPSQAQIMMRQGNDQAIANQMAMAAGARGPAAMAGAQQQAMGNAANMSTQNQNNMGALRAQEMAQARGAYMQGASGMRGQDQSQAQYGSDLEMRQRQLGLQGQMGYEQMGLNAQNSQLGAQMSKHGAGEDHWKAQMATDAASTQNAYSNGLAAAKDGADLLKDGLAASDVRAKNFVRYEGVDPLTQLRGK